jgi:hypothetical protein
MNVVTEKGYCIRCGRMKEVIVDGRTCPRCTIERREAEKESELRRIARQQASGYLQADAKRRLVQAEAPKSEPEVIA